MNDLDFFGTVLEETPLREQFWPSYERLADTVFSLRQAILACMEADDTRDTVQSACLRAAQRHVEDAALHLSKLTQDAFARQSEELGLGSAGLDQLDPSRQAANRNSGLEALWDHLLSAYDAVFKRIRIAHIAHPTGDMDQ